MIAAGVCALLVSLALAVLLLMEPSLALAVLLLMEPLKAWILAVAEHRRAQGDSVLKHAGLLEEHEVDE